MYHKNYKFSVKFRVSARLPLLPIVRLQQTRLVKKSTDTEAIRNIRFPSLCCSLFYPEQMMHTHLLR